MDVFQRIVRNSFSFCKVNPGLRVIRRACLTERNRKRFHDRVLKNLVFLFISVKPFPCFIAQTGRVHLRPIRARLRELIPQRVRVRLLHVIVAHEIDATRQIVVGAVDD